LLFSVLKRDARANAYTLTSTGAVAALSRLRQQSFPSLPEIPYFGRRDRASAAPRWLETAARQAFYASVVAGLVLTAAITLPAFFSAQQGSSASAATALHSSIGVTGSPDTTVGDLSLSTFTGKVPFIQQANYYGSVTGTTPAVQRFVSGARQAELAEYVTDVGEQVTLRYLSNAVQAKAAVAAWEDAEEEARKAAALLAPRPLAAAAPASFSSIPWQSSSLAPGTRIAASLTFYACIGNGFCGNMANGVRVAEGYAACSYNMPFGTRFRVEGDPSGRVFTCADRGALGASHVDVFFYNAADGYAWQSMVGVSGTIVIL
jgi:hypothetical protein